MAVISRRWRQSILSALALLAVFCARVNAAYPENGKTSEADIARETASVLDRMQFSRRTLDAALSSQFLDTYLDALDSAHLLFLQGDLDDFEPFRDNLAEMTAEDGDTEPAHVIYARYLERLAQQVAFQTNLLHTAKFDFTGNSSWQVDRRDAPPPRDLAAAKTLWQADVRKDYLREELADVPPAKIAPSLARRYDRRLLAMQRLKPAQVLEIYLDALAHVYDPHSDYLGPQQSENFNIEMNSSLVGIGGSLKMKHGYCVITDLIPGGPAARSGLLKPGDRIVAVAQDGGEPVNIMGMPSMQVVELIRGSKGSTVTLTIIPLGMGDSARRTVSLVRDEIKLAEGQAKAAIVDLPQAESRPMRIGVLDLPLFYGSGDGRLGGVSADAARLIKELRLEGAVGLVLDLRRNPGGSLEEAIKLAGLFIPAGPVVQILGPNGDVEVGVSHTAKAFYDGPLVVLTSRLSASASEIVAGALQDYGRAVIVGDSATFGKGTVQDVVPLREFADQPGLGAVNVTVAKFYRPSGASTQVRGVVPDIILPSETDLPDIGESNLLNAFSWDILPTTSYTKFDLLGSLLDGLREKSNVRVNSDPGFRLLREELAMAQKDEATQLVSLNEADARGAKTNAEAIKAAVNKLFVSKPGLNPADEIVLRETENILADYIRAGPRLHASN